MAASRLLILMHCTYTKIFLKEAEIIFTEVNITFEEYDKVFQYDLKDAPDQLAVNEDWKPHN